MSIPHTRHPRAEAYEPLSSLLRGALSGCAVSLSASGWLGRAAGAHQASREQRARSRICFSWGTSFFFKARKNGLSAKERARPKPEYFFYTTLTPNDPNFQ
jgi:hypothetical protein